MSDEKDQRNQPQQPKEEIIKELARPSEPYDFPEKVHFSGYSPDDPSDDVDGDDPDPPIGGSGQANDSEQ